MLFMRRSSSDENDLLTISISSRENIEVIGRTASTTAGEKLGWTDDRRRFRTGVGDRDRALLDLDGGAT